MSLLAWRNPQYDESSFNRSMNKAQEAARWGGVLTSREKRKLGPAMSPGWEGPAGRVVSACPSGPMTFIIMPKEISESLVSSVSRSSLGKYRRPNI